MYNLLSGWMSNPFIGLRNNYVSYIEIFFKNLFLNSNLFNSAHTQQTWESVYATLIYQRDFSKTSTAAWADNEEYIATEICCQNKSYYPKQMMTIFAIHWFHSAFPQRTKKKKWWKNFSESQSQTNRNQRNKVFFFYAVLISNL